MRLIIPRLLFYLFQLTMAQAGPPLTTHILDTARGVPAASVPIVLSIQKANGTFAELSRGTTNNDGRAGFLEGSDQWGAGVYRLHFETETYFNSQNIAGFYPFVEVVFKLVDPNQHYHVPLLLSPYSFSTYRGS